ncbi:MAG: hypothetical protein K2X81_25170 [Candidatus Obscuribacterales bacterium]|nr:hypothetical protein [Candidatus Obscuribacterales bacterium]
MWQIIAGFIAGLGALELVVAVVTICAWVQGIIMVFKASLVLGIVSLFFQVPYCIEALVYWVTGYDIALHIAQAMALS